MKIAIDGRSLRKRSAGVPNFSPCHDQFAWQKPGWDIFILTNEPLHPDTDKRLTQAPNVYLIISPFWLFKKVAIIWYLFKVPGLVKKLDVDIFYTPIPNLPLWLPKKTTTFVAVHDMVYKLFFQTMSSTNWWINFFLHDRTIRKSHLLWAVAGHTRNEIEMPFREGGARKYLLVHRSTKRSLSAHHHSG